MRKSRKIFLLSTALLVASATASCAWLAQGPDFEITMERDIPSKLDTSYLDQMIASLKTWPTWFHSDQTADEVDFRGDPYPKSQQKVESRGLISLGMKSPMGLRPYVVTLLVTNYTPGQKIQMRVVSDSKHKLTRLFDNIEWEIDLTPKGNGSVIRGICRAHTRNWRSRLFGKITPNVILNQIFYPDLFVLAEINNPSVVNPDPGNQGM